MISIELWRPRIGGWGGKGRLPRACDETHNFYPITVFLVQNQIFSMAESRAYEYYILFT